MPVVHLVFLKLDPARDSAPVFAALRSLKGAIPGLLDFSGGPNCSTEGLGGYSHAFSMVFESAEARDAYLPHPAHLAAKEVVLSHLEPGAATPVSVVDVAFGAGGK
jgi:hypothetical protein